MKLVPDTAGGAIFVGGRYAGSSLEKVASDDPAYLNWFYREETYRLTDQMFYLLEDVMKKHQIAFDRENK
jgi:hypothetical protein